MGLIDGFLKSLEGDGLVCMSCGRRSDNIAVKGDGVGLCKNCYAKFMKSRVDDYYDVGGNIVRLFAPFGYDGKIKQMIHKMKFCGEKAYAAPLAELMFEALPPYYDFSWFDMIIPVPLHRTRLEERGFNQVELMAAALAERMDIPMKNDLLFRIRETERQMNLTRTMRIKNVKGAFLATEAVRDKNILLVDDIYTVGATAGECAQELKANGAKTVNAVVLCTNFRDRYFERPPTIPAIRNKKITLKG